MANCAAPKCRSGRTTRGFDSARRNRARTLNPRLSSDKLSARESRSYYGTEMLTRGKVAIALGLVCVAQPAWGASRTKVPAPPERLVQREVDRAKSVLGSDDPAQILDAPY